MVGTSGIAWRRPYALIPLLNQFLVGEGLVRRVTPIVSPDLLMKILSTSLRKPVRDGFGQDGIVVVAPGFVIVCQLFKWFTCRYDESSEIVRARGMWCNPITQAQVRLTIRLVRLLSEMMQRALRFKGFRVVQNNVVAVVVGRPKAKGGRGMKPRVGL